jgi:hypothetical protein
LGRDGESHCEKPHDAGLLATFILQAMPDKRSNAAGFRSRDAKKGVKKTGPSGGRGGEKPKKKGKGESSDEASDGEGEEGGECSGLLVEHRSLLPPTIHA